MKLILTKIKEHLGLFLTAIFFLTIESLSDLLQPTLMSHIVDDARTWAQCSILGALCWG